MENIDRIYKSTRRKEKLHFHGQCQRKLWETTIQKRKFASIAKTQLFDC